MTNKLSRFIASVSTQKFNNRNNGEYSELRVLYSNAGYYIGRTYNGIEPGSRESKYYNTIEEAEFILAMFKAGEISQYRICEENQIMYRDMHQNICGDFSFNKYNIDEDKIKEEEEKIEREKREELSRKKYYKKAIDRTVEYRKEKTKDDKEYILDLIHEDGLDAIEGLLIYIIKLEDYINNAEALDKVRNNFS